MALIRGTADADRLDGTGASDFMLGFAGDDTVFAGGDDDTVVADTFAFDAIGEPYIIGNDVLWGGAVATFSLEDSATTASRARVATTY
jgi:hypothetical protein